MANRIAKITDLIQDDKNFNKGTDEGQRLMEQSLVRFGAGRSILIDKDNRIIAGNKTAKTFESLGHKKVRIIETTGDELIAVKRTDIGLDTSEGRELALADNATARANLEWDEELLSELKIESGIDIGDWNVDIQEPVISNSEDCSDNTSNDDYFEKESFAKSMMGDFLYDTDNDFDIPNLLIDQQPAHLELPITPWGANSRLKTGITTYHFYVDDYRFEALFKDPIKLILSGCKAIVEPNCSIHDQLPIPLGLQRIYRKRYLARYLQECGVKVWVDLNVAHKFKEYNKMGVPRGYNAFFTRGMSGWLDSLNDEFQTAQDISGLDKPNMVVYGGGKEIKEFCQQKGLLYYEDFINVRKENILAKS